ncbi:MAG: DUF2203 domain-containing protein [Candidatus Promineifilaceae bacterium]
MPVRYFTLDEANALLPEIRPLMSEMLNRRGRVVESRHELIPILKSPHQDVGGGIASDVVHDFVAIERLAKKIRGYGCVIKDLNAGLVDFLSERDGRDVYLCWRYGEPSVEYYHELHTGFNGREPV